MGGYILITQQNQGETRRKQKNIKKWRMKKMLVTGLFLALALFIIFLGAGLLLGRPEQLGIPTLVAFILAAYMFYTVSLIEAVDYILLQPLEKIVSGNYILTFLEWSGLFFMGSILIFGIMILLNGISSFKDDGPTELFQ